LVVTSGFSRDARDEAELLRSNSQRFPVNIELLDISELLSWLGARDSRSQYGSGEEYWRRQIAQTIELAGHTFVHRDDVYGRKS
jgi:hypothetical protein